MGRGAAFLSSAKLHISKDENIVIWFCSQLSKYVTPVT